MRLDIKGATLYRGDCLEVMEEIPDGSVDLVLTDPPYGTTACKWDAVIPLDAMWTQLKRIIKPNGATVMTASQPFTSALVMSNPKTFKYCWVWDKVNRYTGMLNANRMPLRRHEDVVVFYSKPPTYNKQWREGKPYNVKRTGEYSGLGEHHAVNGVNEGKHNPCTILDIKADNKLEMGLHPTQKPVALMEYLIKTYSNPGDTVLDFTMGSGTTGVACVNLGRKFIGIERDEQYHAIAAARILGAII